MALFSWSSEHKINKKIEEVLRERIAEIQSSLEPEKPSILKWRHSSSTFDPLKITRIVIKGISNIARHGMSAIPMNTIHRIGANVGLDLFNGYFESSYQKILTPQRSTGQALSHYLVTDNKISAKYRYSIYKMRTQIRATIFAVAEFIEAQELTINTSQFYDIDPAKQRQISTFVDSRYQWKTSYRSIRTAIYLFVQQNNELERRINIARKTNSKDLFALLQMNAVLVYEVADVLIGFLQSFEIQGIGALRRLYDEIIGEVNRGRAQLQSMTSKVESAEKERALSEERIEKFRYSIQTKSKTLDLLEEKWQALMSAIDQSLINPSIIGRIIKTL